MMKTGFIFLSYQRENDKANAQAMKKKLEVSRFKIWMDQDIVYGEGWEKSIDRRLHKAKAVVVLWSSNSIKSDWVQYEASIGKSEI